MSKGLNELINWLDKRMEELDENPDMNDDYELGRWAEIKEIREVASLVARVEDDSYLITLTDEKELRFEKAWEWGGLKMSNYNDINNLITSFSGHKNVISFPVIYLDIAEDMNTAALLNQMVFWSDKSKRRDGFFYKTYLEWTEEIRLSEYQLRRSVKKLRDLGFIETKVKRANGSPTTHYKVNMDKISESILKELQFRNQTNSSGL